MSGVASPLPRAKRSDAPSLSSRLDGLIRSFEAIKTYLPQQFPKTFPRRKK